MKDKAESFHGLLLVDKPQGITSHDVVSQIRRKLKTKEVGHCGTLDPLATGLMVVLLGEATKLSQFVLEQDKRYIVKFKLGITTDTWDTSGKIITEKSQIDVRLDEVLSAAQQLTGIKLLSVPVYSAIKIDGQKLYEKARKDENANLIETPLREMDFKVVKYLSGGVRTLNEYEFDITCSKGSYIRTWVNEMGKLLGTGATMSALRRISSIPFSVEQALPLDTKGEDLVNLILSEKSFIPLKKTLPHFKVVRVKNMSETLIRNGQISHELKRVMISIFNPEIDSGIKVMTMFPEQLVALVIFDKTKGLIVRRVFKPF